MSHEQSSEGPPDTPITYGDVFNIQGDLAKKPIAPRDASLMQILEIAILGGTPKGGVAARLQAAAAWNEMAGLVGPNDMNYVSSNLGLDMSDSPRSSSSESSCSESEAPTIFQTMPRPKEHEHEQSDEEGGESGEEESITIGEALEAAALTAEKKAADAAAIEGAELVRATGQTTIAPDDGVAAAPQPEAATGNNAEAAASDEEKTKLADVLTDASSKLPSDKAATTTRCDAEGVSGAEMQNSPCLTTHPPGVSAAVASAAHINNDKM